MNNNGNAGTKRLRSGVDRTLRAFLGESDNMMPTDFAALLAVAGADSSAALLAKSDEEIARAIVSGGFGIQRIASQLLFATRPSRRTSSA